MKIHIERARCFGHAVCVARAPELFKLDDDGQNISDGTFVPADQENKARDAALACPEEAIQLEDGYGQP